MVRFLSLRRLGDADWSQVLRAIRRDDAANIFALLTFALGFLVRPIGEDCCFGRYGDILGRKTIFSSRSSAWAPRHFAVGHNLLNVAKADIAGYRRWVGATFVVATGGIDLSVAKTFGAVRALYLVDLSVERGEVLGLVGDNAAGKSTLMKILSGAYQPDSGAIEIEGAAVAFPGPHAARAFGIEMIYQDYALVPALTVTQNIFLGREILGRWPILRMLQQRRMDERAKALFAMLGLRVPSVSSPVRELSGGQQQAVAIVRRSGSTRNW